ncbi:MAG: KilA-N domain-containing protein [bacterium]|nr:KilA-N domain-containing protein [bacterium]
MNKKIPSVINANGRTVTVLANSASDDYISLTDIARYKNDDTNAVIQNWMRGRDTIDFLGLWEKINNADFKPLEFEGFRSQAGSNAFTLSPQKWIKATKAIGIISKSGRYGGTYAHKDIAFEFASWVSPEFKLYIIKDYQRLKSDEKHNQALQWSVQRILASTNYKLHTDAIKEKLIPHTLTQQQQGYKYAEEADILNMALFGMTAKEWRDKNPVAEGNIRDNATIEQLIVLVNMESMNAEMIKAGILQPERMRKLNAMAIGQLTSLIGNKSIEKLKKMRQKEIMEALPDGE